MRRNESYTLTEIAGVPYLLPFGQMIADHKPGIRINKTGIFLWKLLEEERSMEELVRLCGEFYEVTDSHELQELSQDVHRFTESLSCRGILTNTTESASFPCEKILRIGGLTTRFLGPEGFFPSEFGPYCIEPCELKSDQKIHQTIRIHTGVPPIIQNGTMLLRNEELVVMENTDNYILLFPTSRQIKEAHLLKDGSSADFYCVPPYTETFQENLFHAIRLVWLYLAQKHNMMVIHSASILYQGKAWLFSAPSGTGKSTHTNLWNQLFDTPVLNGDLNLMSIQDGQTLIHGLPWCGTSGLSHTGTYPLGGIILLRQDARDYVEELSPDARQLAVLNRLISPFWNADMLAQNSTFVQALADRILICRLNCTKEPSAAQTMQKYIDDYICRNTLP